MRLQALAPGKVNLCLFLGEPRADGLHPLVSVVQPVSLADVLTLEPGADVDAVECPGVPGENLASRALAAYREAAAWDAPPVRLHIDKRVPVAAGMGGGSGDAAAALRLAAHLHGGDRSAVLRGLAPALGADVPAQIEPRRVFVTGAGENVEAVAPGPPSAYLILPSEHALSTPDVFREADRLGLARPAEELAALAERVRAAASALPGELVVNDLEPAARSLCPSIDAALADARAAGAEHALVSGSGPTVFGVFPDEAAAGAARERLRDRHPRALVATPAGPELARVRAL